MTDSRYALQSRQEVTGCRRVISSLGLVEAAAAEGVLDGAHTVGFEGDQLTYAQFRSLKRLFRKVSFRSVPRVIEDLVLVKDPGEVECLRRAAGISDRVFGEILDQIRPGIPEREIAAEISRLQKRHGAERDAFESIIVAGPRGALPHARATARKIRAGEFLTLDFGCVVNGYHSDLTRTVAISRASRRMRAVYDAVLSAQRAALASARGGMWARDLDAVARDRVRAAGLAKYFTHGLGHGLGLEIHERPRVSALSRDKLRAGSVITVEPGVYIPGFGGVRIEDDIVLTHDGCRVLNRAPKEFMII
jgi:Xaa-Pro aminopeptidase